ncbi:hypothetical protein C8Q74DRAFT_64883 [Fomes fomentarius]|nr:hypothetical protein C8Q74DRAFT_64883 [Fomes fomentarius]
MAVCVWTTLSVFRYASSIEMCCLRKLMQMRLSRSAALLPLSSVLTSSACEPALSDFWLNTLINAIHMYGSAPIILLPPASSSSSPIPRRCCCPSDWGSRGCGQSRSWPGEMGARRGREGRQTSLFNILAVRRKLRTTENSSMMVLLDIGRDIIKPCFGRPMRENSSSHFLVITSPCRVFLLPFIRPLLPPPPYPCLPCLPRQSPGLPARRKTRSRTPPASLSKVPPPPPTLPSASAAVLQAVRTRRLLPQRLLLLLLARPKLQRDRGADQRRGSRKTTRRPTVVENPQSHRPRGREAALARILFRSPSEATRAKRVRHQNQTRQRKSGVDPGRTRVERRYHTPTVRDHPPTEYAPPPPPRAGHRYPSQAPSSCTIYLSPPFMNIVHSCLWPPAFLLPHLPSQLVSELICYDYTFTVLFVSHAFPLPHRSFRAIHHPSPVANKAYSQGLGELTGPAPSAKPPYRGAQAANQLCSRRRECTLPLDPRVGRPVLPGSACLLRDMRDMTAA